MSIAGCLHDPVGVPDFDADVFPAVGVGGVVEDAADMVVSVVVVVVVVVDYADANYLPSQEDSEIRLQDRCLLPFEFFYFIFFFSCWVKLDCFMVRINFDPTRIRQKLYIPRYRIDSSPRREGILEGRVLTGYKKGWAICFCYCHRGRGDQGPGRGGQGGCWVSR